MSVKDWEFPPDIVIPSVTSEVHEVQERILAELERARFSEREIFGIKLAIEEALVNAMKHGNQLDRSKKVRVSYTIDEECFRIRVCDEGPGFNPEEVPDCTREENLERSCGRGLMLMRYYMNEVHFLDRGNVIVMWKRRNGTPS